MDDVPFISLFNINQNIGLQSSGRVFEKVHDEVVAYVEYFQIREMVSGSSYYENPCCLYASY